MPNFVNWVPLVSATLAAVPAAAIFFVSYGRYDGAFRDRTVFLYFIGGLVVGGFLGLFTLLLSGTSAALIEIVGMALLYPITLVLALNRRKWQGDPHAIFNGGAVGLGAAVMMAFSVIYSTMARPLQAAQSAADAAIAAKNLTDADGFKIVRAPPVDSAQYAFGWNLDGQALALAIGLAGLMFGLGLLMGDGVRRRKQLVVALTGTAIVLAPAVFLEEYFASLAWLWLFLLVAYAAIFAIAAERRLLPLGMSDEDRRARRRKLRGGADEE